jgi:hypothetical protein
MEDWSKSERARLLLDSPLVLYAASRPLYEYPLELVLRITVPLVTETADGSAEQRMTMNAFFPDAEVAHELAALLTVLCRRLITVSGKASELHADHQYPVFNHIPLPLATSMRKACWPPPQEYGNKPLASSVDPNALKAMLLGLPRLEHAESVVASARLYALALELIHEQPDIAYQLLISSVETIANQAERHLQPDDDAKVEHQKAVFDLALEIGRGLKGLAIENGQLTEVARKLAIMACKKEHWATTKFKKFLTDNVDHSVWDKEDDLFWIPLKLLPRRQDFQRVLGKIYDARSKATHLGQRFPAEASFSGGPTVSVNVMLAFFRSDSRFPPVVWFERIVNTAIRTFWERSVATLQATGA